MKTWSPMSTISREDTVSIELTPTENEWEIAINLLVRLAKVEIPKRKSYQNNQHENIQWKN